MAKNGKNQPFLIQLWLLGPWGYENGWPIIFLQKVWIFRISKKIDATHPDSPSKIDESAPRKRENRKNREISSKRP